MSSSTQDFLVEIGGEELPPKSLLNLSNAFSELVETGLKAHKLCFSSITAYAAPRRLALLVSDLSTQEPDANIENIGPPVSAAFDSDGNPTRACEGFAKKNAVAVEDLERIVVKGVEKLVYRSTKSGQATVDLLPNIINQALAKLPIAKRMRWGDSRTEFVRPVHWIIMLFGQQVVPATIMGLTSSNMSYGHRFHANQAIAINTPSAYVDTLLNAGKVMVDFAQRQDTIRSGVTAQGEQLGGIAVISDDLLNEVTALVEWPVPLAGQFDESFLDVPSEALISSMKEHQKYFHVVDAEGKLLPHFITVANIESREPERVIDGNERVIRPRLADAKFFFDTDKKTAFSEFRSRLKPVTFQAKLGSIYEKTERIASLASYIANVIGANEQHAQRAGQLCKCDLVTDMVLEFSDLQGLMGQYYAQHSGEAEDVATAMYEQYLPSFAGDNLPTTDIGTCVALADRLDTLVGIFGIGQLPTGSKDPFALRRASLGILRILVEKNINISLSSLIEKAILQHRHHGQLKEDNLIEQVNDYILDRFSAWFQDQGMRTESYLAVRALNPDNACDIALRVNAVNAFSTMPEASALAGANKRVSNILAKLDSEAANLPNIDNGLFVEAAEKHLFSAIEGAKATIEPMLTESRYTDALSALAVLQEPVDEFFVQCMVMDDNISVRNNRLALLASLRNMFLNIADISILPTEK